MMTCKTTNQVYGSFYPQEFKVEKTKAKNVITAPEFTAAELELIRTGVREITCYFDPKAEAIRNDVRYTLVDIWRYLDLFDCILHFKQSPSCEWWSYPHVVAWIDEHKQRNPQLFTEEMNNWLEYIHKQMEFNYTFGEVLYFPAVMNWKSSIFKQCCICPRCRNLNNK